MHAGGLDTVAGDMKSKRFVVGVVLLVINVPFGYGGMAVCAALAASHPDRVKYYTVVGGSVYALSWIMLGLGAWLAGPEGVRYSKELMRKWFKRGGGAGTATGSPASPNDNPKEK